MKYVGVDMQLPEGKRPGYYAQFVKALAAGVKLHDRDKELLIVDGGKEREALLALLGEYRFEYEELELLALPDDAETTPLFEDYGFVSISGSPYLYDHLCAVFRFDGDAEERAQAVAQMQEHLIARFRLNGETAYAVDRSLTDLMHGIARAYHCSVKFEEDL